MAKCITRQEFKISPCKIDNDILKELGDIIEEQSRVIYDHFKSELVENRSKSEYYQKYPEKIEDDLEATIGSWRYEPHYSLEAPTVNIESESILDFIKNEIPTDVERIEMSVGKGESPRKVEITFLIAGGWNPKKSKVSISGIDSTWVFGTAERMKKVFAKRLLGYHHIVENTVLRYVIAVIMWVSLSYTLIAIIFPIISPFLKEGISWILLFALMTLCFGMLGVFALESVVGWLFPQFELKNGSKQKTLRKGIIAFLLGSGLLTELLKALIGFR